MGSDEFDPKLRECMDELKAVMTKYDCGGFVCLSSKTHTEWEMHIPSWSIANFTDEGKLHIKHKGDDPEKKVESTMHFLLSVRDTCMMMGQQLHKVYLAVSKQVQVEHQVQTPKIARGS